MVIDVEPDFGAAHELRGGPEAALSGRVERYGHVKILRLAQGRLQECAARQETVFLQEAVFIANHDCLAELGKREGQPELTAKRIAIRAHMTEHGEALVSAQDGADLVEGRVAHSFSAGGISICCRISKTRAPRSMESSR